jgi:hypothetical protein
MVTLPSRPARARLSSGRARLRVNNTTGRSDQGGCRRQPTLENLESLLIQCLFSDDEAAGARFIERFNQRRDSGFDTVETSALFKILLITDESRPEGANMANC